MLSRRNFMKRISILPLAFIFPQCLFQDKTNQTKQSLGQLNSNDNIMNDYIPPYVSLQQSGVLKKRGEELWERMKSCDLCPRNCGVDRLSGKRGVCKANSDLEIASYGPHFGEESELVGRHGSGTIFFTNCPLCCVFCINYDISQQGAGRRYSIDDLADMMIDLQNQKRHNINLVTPTHYSPHILLALAQAAQRGLRLPVVYNTCGWEKVEILKYFDNVVDIYLPDFKYGCGDLAGKYSIGAYTYVEFAQKAHIEMQKQVGVAVADDTGIMKRGLMIRHLVMPSDVSCTKEVMVWIADNLPKETYINLMSQYTPMFRAKDYPEINRRITNQEYRDAVASARSAGLTNLKLQGG